MNHHAIRPRPRKAALGAFASALALAALLSGCSAPAAEQASEPSDGAQEQAEQSRQTPYPLTIAQWDGDGNQFEQTYEKAPERVICLTDSTAEIMCRLGLADKVIGTVDPEASMPGDIASEYEAIPKLGDKKTLSREVIVGSDPDLVMGRAMTFTSQEQTDPASYNDLGIDLYVQTATSAKGDPTLQGVIDDVRDVARIFDVEEKAEPIVEEMESRLAAMEEKVGQARTGEQQSVLIMTNFKDGTFGTFGGATGASLQFNIVDQLGGTMASTESGSGLTYENLVALDPDVIVYVTADRNKETDSTVLETLYGEESIQSVPAIADKRVVEIPYAEFMDTTPRVFDSAEKILETLYPAS